MVDFACQVCGKAFRRSPAQVANGAGKTCSIGCKRVWMRQEGNAFRGRIHTPEAREKMAIARRARAAAAREVLARKGYGHLAGNQHAKGYRHTEEARKRIAEASRRMWAESRDKMIQSLPRGEAHHFHKPPDARRYRGNFTPLERREWLGSECFYCKTTERLELDHIIPVFDGGTKCQANVQTLCRGCNLWKVHHVDLPRYHARLGSERG